MATIHVDIHIHAETGMMLATSEDLKGLYAHGRAMDDLEKNITLAIKDILEARSGHEVEVWKDVESSQKATPFKPFLDFRAGEREAA